jgi:hypothetical protein
MTVVGNRHTRDVRYDYSGATDLLFVFAVVVCTIALFTFVPGLRDLGMAILEGWSYIYG